VKLNKGPLGRWDAMAINLGIIIGVGIFRVPCDVAKCLHSTPLILLAWSVGAVISFMGACCYAELSTSFPETGGDYIYLRNAYGKLVAFLYGWTNLIIIRPGTIAAVSFLLADYACGLCGLGTSWSKTLALAAVVIFAGVNIRGTEWGRTVQNGLSLAKVLALILLIWCGFGCAKGNLSFMTSITHEDINTNLIMSFGLAQIPILWTYGGWQESVFVAGETRDAKKSLPFALLSTVILVGVIYLLLNAVFLYLFPPNQLSTMTLVASDVLRLLWGETGAKLLAVLVVLCASGCVNGMIITSSRLTFSMFQDIPALKVLSDPDLQCGAPRKAILVNALGSAVFIIVGSFDRLLFFTGIVVWIFFALVGCCIFVFRHRYPQAERPCPVFLYPWLPAGFILVCLGLSLDTFLKFPEQSLLGLTLVAIGVPVFYFLRHCVRA